MPHRVPSCPEPAMKDDVAEVRPPPLGTIIDNEYELVSVLGVGGYGVCYRARAFHGGVECIYAIKCLLRSENPRQRALHQREINLHRLASSHPNVVQLYDVLCPVSHPYTFLVMEYAPAGDLFTMILHRQRYLGNSALISHVFLQLVDGVQWLHDNGIYHRDLKPENIVCADDGARALITDFGLATIEERSIEFRTGSVYHMSPECLDSLPNPLRSYSPAANDIWSLGIMLLNLITGRNPWRRASLSDPTFAAYLRSPSSFLPTVLPISDAANALVVQLLQRDPQNRISLEELRKWVRQIPSWYAHDVVFEGSMAKCSWERGVPIEGEDGSKTRNSVTYRERSLVEDSQPPSSSAHSAVAEGPSETDVSRWSADSLQTRQGSVQPDSEYDAAPTACGSQSEGITAMTGSPTASMDDVTDRSDDSLMEAERRLQNALRRQQPPSPINTLLRTPTPRAAAEQSPTSCYSSTSGSSFRQRIYGELPKTPDDNCLQSLPSSSLHLIRDTASDDQIMDNHIRVEQKPPPPVVSIFPHTDSGSSNSRTQSDYSSWNLDYLQRDVSQEHDVVPAVTDDTSQEAESAIVFAPFRDQRMSCTTCESISRCEAMSIDALSSTSASPEADLDPKAHSQSLWPTASLAFDFGTLSLSPSSQIAAHGAMTIMAPLNQKNLPSTPSSSPFRLVTPLQAVKKAWSATPGKTRTGKVGKRRTKNIFLGLRWPASLGRRLGHGVS